MMTLKAAELGLDAGGVLTDLCPLKMVALLVLAVVVAAAAAEPYVNQFKVWHSIKDSINSY